MANITISGITPETIELSGVGFRDGEKVQQIMDICHKYKHLYIEGYPCGRKTRKEKKLKLKKWVDCPEICFTYLITNDNETGNLAIKLFISHQEQLAEKYSEKEILYFLQMFSQSIAEEIIKL